MNFEPEELNFDPSLTNSPTDAERLLLAEASIARTIVQGSGGPENHDHRIRITLCPASDGHARNFRFGFMP